MQNTEKNELITKAKELLKSEVTEISYNTWINNIEISRITDDTIYILSQNIVHKDMLESRYLPLLTTTFSFITHKNYEIKIVLEDEAEVASTPIIQEYTA